MVFTLGMFSLLYAHCSILPQIHFLIRYLHIFLFYCFFPPLILMTLKFYIIIFIFHSFIYNYQDWFVHLCICFIDKEHLCISTGLCVILAPKDKFKSKISKSNMTNNLILIIILSNYVQKSCALSWNLN